MLFKRKKISAHQVRPIIAVKKKQFTLNFSLIVLVLILSLFGLLMIYDASVVAAFRDFGDKYHFVRDQSLWLLLGMIALFTMATIDYRTLYRYSDFLLCGIVVLLIAVFIPGIGIEALGARRWINFHFFILQPAELTKLVMIIFLSSWLSDQKKHNLVKFLGLVGLVLGLVVLEPDLGTAIIILAIAFVLYFVSGAPLWHFMLLLPLALGSVGTLALIAPYRLQRVLTFFNPSSDPLGTSYHIRQVLLALGSGGMFGLGIGNSRQKYEYLPEASTDSIFAVVGEELGFIGALVLILAFLFLIYRIIGIARKSPDTFGMLVATGVGAWIGVQVLLNLGSMVALVPLTGVPLPFISYGGSNLVVTMAAIGVVLNISRQKNK